MYSLEDSAPKSFRPEYALAGFIVFNLHSFLWTVRLNFIVSQLFMFLLLRIASYSLLFFYWSDFAIFLLVCKSSLCKNTNLFSVMYARIFPLCQ